MVAVLTPVDENNRPDLRPLWETSFIKVEEASKVIEYIIAFMNWLRYSMQWELILTM